MCSFAGQVLTQNFNIYHINIRNVVYNIQNFTRHRQIGSQGLSQHLVYWKVDGLIPLVCCKYELQS